MLILQHSNTKLTFFSLCSRVSSWCLPCLKYLLLSFFNWKKYPFHLFTQQILLTACYICQQGSKPTITMENLKYYGGIQSTPKIQNLYGLNFLLWTPHLPYCLILQESVSIFQDMIYIIYIYIAMVDTGNHADEMGKYCLSHLKTLLV